MSIALEAFFEALRGSVVFISLCASLWLAGKVGMAALRILCKRRVMHHGWKRPKKEETT